MHRWAGHIYPDSTATLELCALVNGVGSQLTRALLLSVGKERKLFCFMIHFKSHWNDGLKIIPLPSCVKTFTAQRRRTSISAICSLTLTRMKHEGNMTILSLWQHGGSGFRKYHLISPYFLYISTKRKKKASLFVAGMIASTYVQITIKKNNRDGYNKPDVQ